VSRSSIKAIQAAAGAGGFDPVPGEAAFYIKDFSNLNNQDTTSYTDFFGSGIEPTTDYSFVVPDGVGEIHVVCVGAGEIGRNATGGDGGGLAYGSMTVVPGETLTVKVGMLGDGTASNRRDGGKSGVYRGATKLISSDGTGSNVANSELGGAGRTGSSYSDGYPGGGGGAAGYSGSGGTGTYRNTSAAYVYGTAGSGGGGGGGGARRRGGGVGVWGEGPSGAAPGTSNYGYPGSYGHEFGSFGGGGTGTDNYVTSPQTYPMNESQLSYSSGRPGAVRICWGNDRAFPTTSIDETDSYSITNFDIANTSGDSKGPIPTLLAYTDGTSKTFTVPDVPGEYDQLYVSAVLVGGGGAGPYGSVDNVSYYGGAGGGLAHFSNLPVSAGDTITYVVGRGGQGPLAYGDTGYNGTANDGGDTTLTYGSFVATAEGGQGGRSGSVSAGGSKSFSNTPSGVTTGGGDGGAGGLGGSTSSQQNYGGGGGGAGGFDGNGGAGGKGIYWDGVSGPTDGANGIGTQSGGGGGGAGSVTYGGSGGANTFNNQSKGGGSTLTQKSSGGGGGAAYTLFNGARSDRLLTGVAYIGTTATSSNNYKGQPGGTPGGGAGSGGGADTFIQASYGPNFSHGGDGAIAIYVHTSTMTLPV